MAVIIRGMDMPACCNDCRMAVWRPRIGDQGYIIQCQALAEGDYDVIDWRGQGNRVRLENCPLEETRT